MRNLATSFHVLGMPVGNRTSGGVATPWWQVAGQTCIAAYCPKGSASLAASYVNLANPGVNNAAPGFAPTLDAAGWVFSTSKYLTTGIVPAAGMTIICRFSNRTAGFYLLAASQSGKTFAVYATTGGKCGAEFGGAYRESAGAVGVVANANGQMYADGSPSGTQMTAGTGLPTIAMFIATQNVNGLPGGSVTAKIQALVVYGTTLTGTDIAALTTRMQAL